MRKAHRAYARAHVIYMHTSSLKLGNTKIRLQMENVRKRPNVLT